MYCFPYVYCDVDKGIYFTTCILEGGYKGLYSFILFFFFLMAFVGNILWQKVNTFICRIWSGVGGGWLLLRQRMLGL